MPDVFQIAYGRTGASKTADDMGMRPMQERVFRQRGARYLLVKAPPASGKSRALMFVGLDKLENQDVRKVIVAVPEKSIGRSFWPADLTGRGFFRDWDPDPRWNLCGGPPTETPAAAKGKIAAFKEFMAGDDRILICTHATLRFAFDDLGAEAFDDCLFAVDEFHHVSASEENRLGEIVRALLARDRAHIVAMTGSYFRGDALHVLHPEDEAKFTRVTYTYYEQLNGYEHLKTLGIGYHFYRGRYLDGLPEVLDTDKKTIIHIPHPASKEAIDKYEEVERIFEIMGTYKGVDPATNFVLIERADGRTLRVANLVDDDQSRVLTQESLRFVENKDDVDVILALGMAKEGFDWIWCEHALTVGYRNSLTEIVQIVGRVTRDAPGKTHAQFTNLVAEPDAAGDQVVDAVNDMLKAISASLLMEQVLAPKFKFKSRPETADDGGDGHGDQEDEGGGQDGDESGGQNGEDVSVDDDTGEVTVRVRRLRDPSTERVRQIVEDDMTDLQATVCNDRRTAVAGAADEAVGAETVNQAFVPRIIEERYPDLSENEVEEVRQQLVCRLNLVHAPPPEENPEDGGAGDDGAEDANEEDGGGTPGSGSSALMRMVRRFINVQNLDIDLVDSVNPFHRAYEVVSKSMDAPTLGQIQSAIAAQRVEMSEDEAVALWPRIKRFRRDNAREPDPAAQDPFERRLGEALAWLKRKKRERERGRGEHAAAEGTTRT